MRLSNHYYQSCPIALCGDKYLESRLQAPPSPPALNQTTIERATHVIIGEEMSALIAHRYLECFIFRWILFFGDRGYQTPALHDRPIVEPA
jgi:hypothetical protein